MKMWTTLGGLSYGVQKIIFRASPELQMPQTTVHRFLRKSLHLKPHKLQVVQKLTAHDKQIRSRFAAHMCTNYGT
jgi:hypothetical protein